MANSYQEFTTEIKLNSENAKNKLEDLKKKTEDLIKKRDQLIQNHGDFKDINGLNQQIQRNEKSMDKLAKTSQGVTDILQNLDKVSLNQLMYAERTLNAEMKKTPQNTKYFEDLSDKLKSVKTQIAGIRTQTKQDFQEQKQLNDEMANMKYVLENISTSSLKELALAAETLKKQMQEAIPGSKGYSDSGEKLKVVQNRIREINLAQEQNNSTIQKYNEELALTKRDAMTIEQENRLINATLKNLDKSSIRDIEYSLKIINEQLRGMDRGTEEFRQMSAQAKKLNTQLQHIRQETSAQSSWIGRFADGFNRAQSVVMAIIAAITTLSLAIRKCVNDFAHMEDVMANVRKYTGQTDAQVREMNEDFKNMNTRTSREQLNNLAGAAGRLGIVGNKMIEEFVDGADKINVALGDDLGDGAVEKIGKLTQMFGEDKRKGLRGAMYATGSAVNELAQNSSANAGYIVDFTADISGVGRQANMAQTQIMGLASALDQNMQDESTAATVFSQLITKMYQDPAKFAKIAGQNVKKFTNLLKTDANGALLQFLSAMKNKGGFAEMAPMFESMNLDGTRAVGVLSSVASHLDQVRAAQKLAATEYNKGTSVLNEFNIQNNTVAAQLDKAKKEFLDLSIKLGQKLMPVARYTISTGSEMIKLLSVIIDFVSKYKITLTSLIIAITALTVVEKFDVICKKLQAFWTDVLVASCKKLWTLIINNPYATATLAAAALVGVIIDLVRQTDNETAAQKTLSKIRAKAREDAVDETEKINTLVAAAKDEKLSLDERQTAIRELNRIIPGYNAQLDVTTNKYKENKSALDNYLKSLVRKYELEGAKDTLRDLGKQMASAKIAADQAKKAFENARKAGKGVTYTTSFGMTSNTTVDLLNKTNQQLAAANNKVKEIRSQQNAVLKTWGLGLQKDVVATVRQRVVNTGGDQTGSGNSTISEKEQKAQEKRQKAREVAERKAQAAADKRRKEADRKELSETNLQLQNLALLYSKGEINYQDFIDRKEAILKAGLEKRKKLWKAGSREYDDILRAEQHADEEHSEESVKMNIKNIEIEQQQRDAAIKAQFYNKDSASYMDEDAVNEALFQSMQDSLKKKMDVYGKGTEEWLNTQAELEDNSRQHQLDNEDKFLQRLAQYREEFGRKDVKEQEVIALRGLDTLHKKGFVKEKEYGEMKRQIQLYYAELQSEQNKKNSHNSVVSDEANTAYRTASNNADAQEGEKKPTLGSYLLGDITRYKDTVEQLKAMYGEDAKNYEAYQQAKSMATDDFIKGITPKIQMAFETVSQIMNAMSGYYSAQSEYEQNVTNKKYEKLEKAAGNNTARTQKLEEKKEKEIARIKSKYNKKQMKMELAQATATMLLGAMRAYTSVWEGAPWPAAQILAPVAAGIAMAAGMINLAAIKKQHQAEEAGYYQGGFTPGMDFRKKAGIVHEGEFVANHNALANASILPVLRLIDIAQKNNTVGSLTATDVSNQLGQGGAAVIAPVVQVNNDNKDMASTINGVSQVVDKLNRTIDRGIPAIVSIDGQNGIAHQLDRFHKLQNNK
ncbi:MAG: phage tail tape measure protein [Prevotella sp.]|jgi:TP901 family phage tail tape measure protein|nr:phage tail tape measure protein [Prevotella sp.]MCH3994275.1 phage tail tape measure protein [Prevotella sp.]